jgi:hypothetical protein
MHVSIPRAMVANSMLVSGLQSLGGSFRRPRWAIPRRGVAKADTSFGTYFTRLRAGVRDWNNAGTRAICFRWMASENGTDIEIGRDRRSDMRVDRWMFPASIAALARSPWKPSNT